MPSDLVKVSEKVSVLSDLVVSVAVVSVDSRKEGNGAIKEAGAAANGEMAVEKERVKRGREIHLGILGVDPGQVGIGIGMRVIKERGKMVENGGNQGKEEERVLLDQLLGVKGIVHLEEIHGKAFWLDWPVIGMMVSGDFSSFLVLGQMKMFEKTLTD